MNRYIVIMTLAYVFLPLNGSTQTPYIDSLMQVYEQQSNDTNKLGTLTHLINAYMYRNPVFSMQLAREKLILAEELGIKKSQSLANFHLGVLQSNLDENDSARFFFNRSRELALQIDDTMRLVLALNGMATLELSQGELSKADSLNEQVIGILTLKDDQYRLSTAYGLKSQINQDKGNYNIAYQNALKSLQILETIDKPVRQADALIHLADIEQKLGNTTQAIDHSKKALVIYREHRDLLYQALVLGNLGELFILQGNYNEALTLLNESIVMADSTNNLRLKASSLSSLGNLFLLQDNTNKALDYLNESLEIATNIGDQPGMVRSMTMLGKVYNKTNNYQRAIQYLNQSIQLSTELEMKPETSFAYQARANSYEKSGLYERALDDLKTHKALSDSMFSEEKINQIEELRIIYESEKKDKEIEIQRYQIELFAQKERNNRSRTQLLIILLISAIISSLLIHQAFHQKLKRRKVEIESTHKMLSLKKREITTQILHMAQKNDLLQELKEMLLRLKQECPNSNIQKQIINKINIDFNNENSWARFKTYFEDLHQGFEDKIKDLAPDVSPGDLRLIALIKMNLNSQEVASVLNISQEGIKKARYRLRKKMKIKTGGSLEDFLAQV